MATDEGTIKIPRDKFEQHNQRRQRMGLTWEEYIDGQAPDLEVTLSDEAVEEIADAVGTPDAEAVAARVVTVLDVSKIAGAVADQLEGRLR